jgi:hypothetical protein
LFLYTNELNVKRVWALVPFYHGLCDSGLFTLETPFCVFQCGKDKNAFLVHRRKMSETQYDTEDELDENEIVESSTTETKQVVVAVQQGQRRRIMKGMTYQTDEKHGYIYLVRTREFKSLNRSVYKVGRTSQCPDTRITRLHK